VNINIQLVGKTKNGQTVYFKNPTHK